MNGEREVISEEPIRRPTGPWPTLAHAKALVTDMAVEQSTVLRPKCDAYLLLIGQQFTNGPDAMRSSGIATGMSMQGTRAECLLLLLDLFGEMNVTERTFLTAALHSEQACDAVRGRLGALLNDRTL